MSNCYKNGVSGTAYQTVNLTSIPLDGLLVVGSTTVSNVDIVVADGFLQNGSPDGVVLCDSLNAVADMTSYEGSFAAVGGCADGETLPSIGTDPDAGDESLQRCPDGSGSFQLLSASTPGTANNCPNIPALSGWGIGLMALILLGATIMLDCRRRLRVYPAPRLTREPVMRSSEEVVRLSDYPCRCCIIPERLERALA